MSPATRAKRMVGETVMDRLSGERPSLIRATTGAVVAGGVTGVVVFRLLRKTEN